MPITATYTLDRVYATTAEAIRPEVARELARCNALTAHMYRQKAVKYQGGSEYRIPVSLLDNTGVVSIAPYGTFTATPQDNPLNARYTFLGDGTTLVAPWTLAKTEMAQNADSAYKVVDLTKSTMVQAADSLGAELSRQLFTLQAGQTLRGLPNFIEASAPAAQTLSPGGIAKATYARWRNWFRQIATWSVDGEAQVRGAILDCSMGGSIPDIILSGQEAYLLMEASLLPNQRDFDKGLANLGYKAVEFYGTPWAPDTQLAGADEIYVLTTTGKREIGEFSLKPEFFAVPGKNPIAKDVTGIVGFHLVILPDHDFILEGPHDVGFQQRAFVWDLAWAGYLATGSIRRQALVNWTGGTVV